jgi:hypothetical protein
MATIKLSTTIAGIVAGATGATGPTGPAGATGASGATTTISNGTSNLNILASGGAIYANTAGTNAITVDTSQRVGIGTVSPSDKFEVVGTTNREYARVESTFSSSGSEAGIRLKTAGTNGREWLIFNGNTEGSLRFYDLTGSAERMRIQSTGKVGIGNSSPDAQNLHVGSGAGGGSINGYTRLAIEASDYAVTTIKAPAANFSQIIFADPTSSNLGGINFFNSTNATPNAMAFYTGGGTERMRIDSNGGLFLNCTTSPTGNGTGVGGIGLRVVSGDAFNMKHESNGSNTFNIWQTGTNSFQAFSFCKGSTQTQVGSISCTTTGTGFNTTSDYRLKNTIAPMTGALAKVALLKPRTYKWNINGSDGQGFIAHELQAVVSEAVTGEKDAVETYTDEEGNEQTRPKYQGIDTSFLIATLTAAIQEQQVIINALTVRLEALENK